MQTVPASLPAPLNASAAAAAWPWTTAVDPAVYDPALPWPRISIVTPSYNQAEYLEETLRSVLLQHYPNLEYIVIDGGSTDGSVALLERYAPWLTYWVSEPDRGQSHAINKGLARATGEIRAYLNSDDTYTPGALLEVVSAWRRLDPQRDYLLVGDCFWGLQYDPDRNYRDRPQPPADYLAAVQQIVLCSQAATFWTVRHQPPQPFNEQLDFVMDYDYWCRLLEKGYALARIPRPLAFFRQHVEAKSSRRQEVMLAEAAALQLMALKHAPSLPALNDLSRRADGLLHDLMWQYFRGPFLHRPKSEKLRCLLRFYAAKPQLLLQRATWRRLWRVFGRQFWG